VPGSTWTDRAASPVGAGDASRSLETLDADARQHVLNRINEAGLANLEEIFGE